MRFPDDDAHHIAKAIETAALTIATALLAAASGARVYTALAQQYGMRGVGAGEDHVRLARAILDDARSTVTATKP